GRSEGSGEGAAVLELELERNRALVVLEDAGFGRKVILGFDPHRVTGAGFVDVEVEGSIGCAGNRLPVLPNNPSGALVSKVDPLDGFETRDGLVRFGVDHGAADVQHVAQDDRLLLIRGGERHITGRQESLLENVEPNLVRRGFVPDESTL